MLRNVHNAALLTGFKPSVCQLTTLHTCPWPVTSCHIYLYKAFLFTNIPCNDIHNPFPISTWAFSLTPNSFSASRRSHCITCFIILHLYTLFYSTVPPNIRPFLCHLYYIFLIISLSSILRFVLFPFADPTAFYTRVLVFITYFKSSFFVLSTFHLSRPLSSFFKGLFFFSPYSFTLSFQTSSLFISAVLLSSYHSFRIWKVPHSDLG